MDGLTIKKILESDQYTTKCCYTRSQKVEFTYAHSMTHRTTW